MDLMSPPEVEGENVKQFHRWVFLNAATCDLEDEVNLKVYVKTRLSRRIDDLLSPLYFFHVSGS